ncbi:MAG: hypothetical protein JXA79_07235, partial [Deltaproteobacteria bacterium]|nr:hypothetical protein [Deltaproteobacteria bacterium]
LLGLVVTVSLETVVLFLLVRLYLKKGRQELSNQLLLFTGIFCSFATLPYLWFVLPYYLRDKSYYLFIIVGEISVTLIESVIIYFVLRLNYRRSLVISVLCNVVSVAFGMLFLR